jgi:hypothetical protein
MHSALIKHRFLCWNDKMTLLYRGGTMPEFTTVSVQEAQLRTILGRPGQFANEYAGYIQQLPQGQAGKLSLGEDEKHTAIRRLLATTAKAMSINLIIKTIRK